MVNNVDRVSYVTRRSRSRTPSRVATPIVKASHKKAAKSEPAKRKGPALRARSKTPTRIIATSTPKPKPKATPKAASTKKQAPKSAEKAKKRKRRSVVAHGTGESDDEDDEVDYQVTKKPKSPKSYAAAVATPSKLAGRPKKSTTTAVVDLDDEGPVRRSRRIKSLNQNSTLDVSETKKKSSSDLSINGGLNQSQNETLNETQTAKWGWFNCAIM